MMPRQAAPSRGGNRRMGFIAELRRRNVIRMAGLYLVGAWLVVQVAGTLLPMFEAPGWVARTIVVLLALAFVPVMIFSWVYELTPEGLKRDAEVPVGQSIGAQTARRMDRAIIVVLLVALVFLAVDRFVLAARREATPAVPAAAAPPPAVAVDPRSIAVLPFADLSREHDQAYFADGIAEELLNRLARVPKLRVAARTSAFRFKGSDLDVADIARQLQVAHVLEGSVRKDGERLRITAQLVRADSGMSLWSQSFDGEAGDVFRVQDAIAGAIATALEAKLAGQAAARDVDPQAYDDFLQGRDLFARRGASLQPAVAAFDRVIARDPAFAPAHASRAFALAIGLNWTPWLPAAEHLAQARASAQRALELDPDNVEAHVVLGYLAMSQWRAGEARAAFERAYALAPDHVDVLNFYGDFHMLIGDLHAAEQLKRRAMALDPLAFVHPLNLMQIRVEQGRPVEALALAERSAALGHPESGRFLVHVQALAGRFDEAERTLAQLCRDVGEADAWCLLARVRLRHAQGRTEEARAAAMTLAALPATSAFQWNRAAIVHALTGDIAGATDAMRRSIDGGVQFAWNPMRLTGRGELLPEEVSTDPAWLALWDDPRVRDWMAEYRRNVLKTRAGG